MQECGRHSAACRKAPPPSLMQPRCYRSPSCLPHADKINAHRLGYLRRQWASKADAEVALNRLASEMQPERSNRGGGQSPEILGWLRHAGSAEPVHLRCCRRRTPARRGRRGSWRACARRPWRRSSSSSRLPLLADHLLFGGDRFAAVSPHPFWIVVLLIAAQYGTSEALAAAALASAALLSTTCRSRRSTRTSMPGCYASASIRCCGALPP